MNKRLLSALLLFAATAAAQSGTVQITTTSPLPRGTVGVPYSLQFASTTGFAPTTWTALNALPPGLSLQPSGSQGGLLSGNPTQAGTYTFNIQATDGFSTDTEAFSLQILPPAPVIISGPALPEAPLGVPYSVQLVASGGLQPLIWSSFSSANVLPPGLSLSSGGLISGTPTQEGTYNFPVSVVDSADRQDNRTMTIVVTNNPVITNTSPLTPGTVGTPYSVQFNAIRGIPPYTFSSAGPLPGGLTLTPSGLLQGTPTTAGTFNFPVTVTESQGRSSTSAFSVQILEALTITTTSPLPVGTVGTAYSTTLQATGGIGTLSWSVSSGSLPPGLSLLQNGNITGNPNTAGDYNFTARVIDSQQRTAERAFLLRIVPALTITTTSPLPDAQVGNAYTQTLQATGGVQPYTWSATGNLPPGVSFSTAGVLSGTPTTAGDYSFTATVRDVDNRTAQRAFTVRVLAPFVISTASPLPEGTTQIPYSVTFTTTGQTGTVSWSATGNLPPGLSFSTAGVLSGTPTTPGDFSFSVTAVDAGTQRTAQKAFTVRIQLGLRITTESPLPSAEQGRPYSASLAAAGGIEPYVFSVSGNLPPGVGLSGNTLTGTPTASGTFGFVATVRDASNQTATKGFSIRVISNIPDLSIITTTLPTGAVGTQYSAGISATGGVQPYSFSGQGLPPGLTLSTTGVLSGTPTAAGTFRMNVLVNDADQRNAGGIVTVTITGTALSITTNSPLPGGRVGTAYSQAFAAAGGTAPYTFALTTGTLPAGLAFANGAISGTPTAIGTSEFTIQVTDATGGRATKSFSLTVGGADPIISTQTLPNGTVTVPYSATVAATGGTTPYSWSITGGDLPGGLALATATGAITGTPTTAGPFTFTVQVQDANQRTAQRQFTVQIASALSITTTTVGPFTVGTAANAGLSATGGTQPFSWSVSAGSLPAGLSLNSASGAITGTPTTAGPFSFTATVTDANQVTATRQFSGDVGTGAPPLSITTASPLPQGTAGTAYTTSFAASGAIGTVTWSVSGGDTPAGLTLSSAGVLSGTPTAPGTSSFTVRAVTPTQTAVTRDYTLTIVLPPPPQLQISGIPANPQPNQQPRLGVALASGFPLPTEGTMTLTFQPNAAVNLDDPAIAFSGGGRTLNFTVPANSTQPVFPAGFDSLIQTGTTAGTITVTTVIRTGATELNRVTNTLVIPRMAPVITEVRVTRIATGFNVEVRGFSTTRELTQGTFRFGGTNLGTTEVIVPVNTQFQQYFSSQQSSPFGSQFLLTQPFTITGEANAVNSVTVILTNTVGASQPSSSNF